MCRLIRKQLQWESITMLALSLTVIQNVSLNSWAWTSNSACIIIWHRFSRHYIQQAVYGWIHLLIVCSACTTYCCYFHYKFYENWSGLFTHSNACPHGHFHILYWHWPTHFLTWEKNVNPHISWLERKI